MLNSEACVMSMTKSARFQDHFAELTDPHSRKVTYPLIHVVVIAVCAVICGKTLRRNFDQASSKSAIPMVSAWATANQINLGQVVVNGKSNEITAIPKLLKMLEISGSWHRQLDVTFQEDQCRIFNTIERFKRSFGTLRIGVVEASCEAGCPEICCQNLISCRRCNEKTALPIRESGLGSRRLALGQRVGHDLHQQFHLGRTGQHGD